MCFVKIVIEFPKLLGTWFGDEARDTGLKTAEDSKFFGTLFDSQTNSKSTQTVIEICFAIKFHPNNTFRSPTVEIGH